MVHAPGAAPLPGYARQIGGVQAEFVHARLHARRHVARAGGVGGNGKPRTWV